MTNLRSFLLAATDPNGDFVLSERFDLAAHARSAAAHAERGPDSIAAGARSQRAERPLTCSPRLNMRRGPSTVPVDLERTIPNVSPRKSYKAVADVEEWVARQGFALERATAEALRVSGYISSLGRHYRDEITGKYREIDLVAQLAIRSDARLYAVVECKVSPSGAWIVRETDLRRDYREWWPLVSETLRATIPRPRPTSFWLGRDERDTTRCAFDVVEATDEGNDRAYDAVAQAVSAATGWAAQIFGPAVVVPVVVVDGPLYALYHATGGDEPLAEVQWRRVLWGGAADQTVVDVVRAECVGEYGMILRTALERLADEIDWAYVARSRRDNAKPPEEADPNGSVHP